jgi:putative ABC transport system permease protein
MLSDLRFALRALRRRRGFSAVAVITLALGIGANATLFSLVYGVLLKPLPYRAPERLAILWHEFGHGAQFLPAMHPLDYRDYQERSRLFEAFTIATGREENLGGTTEPELVQVGLVSSGFLPFLGIEPALGRQFREEEDVAGGPPVALLSHEIWKRRFGGDRGVLGRSMDLGGISYEIVGVLPEAFELLLPAEAFRLRHSDVWRPVQIDYAHLPPRNYTGYTVFGRLKPGVTFAAAEEELAGIAAQLRHEHPEHAASNLRVSLTAFQADVVKGVRRGLLVLMAAVGFVLAIACANVALLLLARGKGRESELLLRVAVGADRWRIARLVLAESLVLSFLGATLGIGLALVGLDIVPALTGGNLPRAHGIAIDGAVVAFVAGLSVLSALVFGLVPALQASRTDLAQGLRDGAVRSGAPAWRRLRDGMVVAQIALSLVLAVGAGLMVRSFHALGASHPGFNPASTLTLRVSVPRGVLTNPQTTAAFHRDLSRRLQALPGVASVGAISLLPLTGRGPLQPYAYDAETARQWESVSADHLWITPDTFGALGASLVAGRGFNSEDLGLSRRLIVIDDTLAQRAFAGREAVGQSLQLEPEGRPESFFEVVGVVSHLRLHDLTRPLLPQIYSPLPGDRFSVVLRTNGVRPADLAPAVRRELLALNPGIAIENVEPFEAVVSRALGPMRLAMTLMSAFGALGLLLAAVGVYGIFSFAVAERRHEMAIRQALGAAPASILRLVLGDGARLVAISLLLGGASAALLSRALSSLLYEVAPLHAPTYAIAAVVLTGVALFACWIPARRISRVNPLEALRES